MILYPEHWPPHHNGGERCDMIDGPCACGAWHHLTEKWVAAGMVDHGLTDADLIEVSVEKWRRYLGKLDRGDREKMIEFMLLHHAANYVLRFTDRFMVG